MKILFRIIYSYDFHISKLNNLKVIHNLYSQCLTQALSKMISLRNLREYSCGPMYIRTYCILYTCACREQSPYLPVYPLVFGWITATGHPWATQ